MKHRSIAAVVVAAAIPGWPARALPLPPHQAGAQITFIDQQLFPFRSPYQGPNSFRSSWQNALTDTYTLFLGVRPLANLDLYLDPELALGTGLGGTVGLAGVTDGDALRTGVSPVPYVARAFLRSWWGMSTLTTAVSADENQISGELPADRLQLTAGKLSVTDLFDQNRYAADTRTQFENWAFITDLAYDYAADTRGYTMGAALEWIHPDWTLRAGSFQMPLVANGPDLDPDLAKARGDQVELELHPALMALVPGQTGAVRLLAYMNHARMGSYAAALAQAAAGQAPDIVATRQPGNIKYGAALNVEQPLADGGETGVFARLGWNDGQTESFAFTEADRAFSIGAQLSGARWGRPSDHWAAALALEGLSPVHAAYLAAGGQGFQLGDGRLDYAPESVLETYYAWQVADWIALSADAQAIVNPGYNADRGPAFIVGLRSHLEW